MRRGCIATEKVECGGCHCPIKYGERYLLINGEGDVTINPDQANIDFTVKSYTLSIPILASAMDAIVDPTFAIKFNKLGGLAVLNLEGIQTRYENPDEVLNQIAQTPEKEVTSLLQKIYSEPIKEKLISQRIGAIKQA
ncbi:unnamed protein product, partial [marine sediment metagenome]